MWQEKRGEKVTQKYDCIFGGVKNEYGKANERVFEVIMLEVSLRLRLW